MFAVAVDGTTFWEEIIKGNVLGGRQMVRQTEVREGRIFQQLDWQATNNVMVLKESRTVMPHAVPGVTLLTWRSCLEPAPGKSAVTFTGHHYYGLGARFVNSMDNVAVFQNASGDPGEYVRGDNQRLAPAAWVSCTGPVDGKPVTIAIFDHPDNLRYPSKKFTMASPFAYISTTLNFWKEPFVLKAGEKLDLLYGVAVWDGAKTPEQMEAVRQQWLKQAL
jgi:hypothetical protein